MVWVRTLQNNVFIDFDFKSYFFLIAKYAKELSIF